MSVTPLDPHAAPIAIGLQNNIEPSIPRLGETATSAGMIEPLGHGVADDMPAEQSNAE